MVFATAGRGTIAVRNSAWIFVWFIMKAAVGAIDMVYNINGAVVRKARFDSCSISKDP
jgi:hypothetical protein